LILLIILNFVIQCLYDIQITTKSFVKQECIRACVVSSYLKRPSQTEIEKLLKKLVEVHFSFLLYKIARALRILLQSNLYCNYFFG
jgi:hypothetical protein